MLAVSVLGVLSPTAAAAAGVVLGGGAGILVNGDTYCTLATIGHDDTGELVGFTDAHCGGPGAQVVAEGSGDAAGSVATVDDRLDYAVIKFDPAKVTPVADFDGFRITGIGPDPGSGQACTQGGATGYGCGIRRVAGLKPSTMTAEVPAWGQGDAGAPVTVDGQLVGMSRKGSTMFHVAMRTVITRIQFTLFTAILGDINAKGGPGAGFVPVPA